MNQALEAVPTATGPDSSRTYRGSPAGGAVVAHRQSRIRRISGTDPDAAPRRLEDFKTLASHDLRQDILACRDMLAARGIEVLVLDQSRPDVGFPVVRVVAPGLRHFWPRFGPGRLYDVPLHAGWLTHCRDEREMNPFPFRCSHFHERKNR